MNINKEKQKLNVLIPLHTILIQIFFFSQKQKTFNKEPSTEDARNTYKNKEIGKKRVK